MWKCKHCGGTEFYERVTGGYEEYSGLINKEIH